MVRSQRRVSVGASRGPDLGRDRTDNTQVKWWITKKLDDSVTTKEIRRLVLNILNFTFTIEVIKTDKNMIADYLSRQSYTARTR